MRSLQYNRRSTEKLSIKGVVGADGVSYVDDVGELKTVRFSDILAMFMGQDVALSVQMNTDEDLLDDGELPGTSGGDDGGDDIIVIEDGGDGGDSGGEDDGDLEIVEG